MPAASERTTTWPERGDGSATSPTTSCSTPGDGSRAFASPRRTDRPPSGSSLRLPGEFHTTRQTRPLAGQVALVTGAARPRGIGRATAVRLARDGADVACLDIARPYRGRPRPRHRQPDDLADLADELAGPRRQGGHGGGRRRRRGGGRGGGGSGQRGTGHRHRGGQRRRRQRPGVRVGAAARRARPAEFRRVLDVNVVGTWLVSKACARRMVAAGESRSDLQRLEPGRQAGLPLPRCLLHGQGRRHPADPDPGRRARAQRASPSTPSAPARWTPT